MRVTRGTVSRRKHNKLQSLTKGYRGTRHKLTRRMTESILHAGQYAYHGRKLKKRNFKSLWITRIGEAVRMEGLSYSVFIAQMKKANSEIDRKILSELLVTDPEGFKQIVNSVKSL